MNKRDGNGHRWHGVVEGAANGQVRWLYKACPKLASGDGRFSRGDGVILGIGYRVSIYGMVARWRWSESIEGCVL